MSSPNSPSAGKRVSAATAATAAAACLHGWVLPRSFPAATVLKAPRKLPLFFGLRYPQGFWAPVNAINPLRSPVEPPIPSPDSADRALEGIVSHIVEDFEKIQCVVVREGIRAVISDALPDKTAIVTAHDTFIAGSWKVTNANMQNLFKLTDAMQHTYAGVPEGVQTLYVRSKELIASDLIIFRDHFARRFHHPEFLGKLDALIALAGNSNVYLRYVGTVVGPRTPRSRYEEDVASNVGLFSKTDLLIREMREVGELGNESDWTVHEFGSLRTAAAGSSDFRTLFVEKILISLFGRDTLINVQPGGYFATYAPTDADVSLFTQINTSVYAHLAALNESPGINPLSGRAIAQHPRLDDTKTHIANVFTFLRAHPQLVANRDINLPLEALDPKSTDVRFLFDESRAGYLARSTIKQLQQHEQAKPTAFVQLLDLLPYVNLYPWLLRHMLARGSVFLSEYMKIVRPWVTITFSGEVTRAIAKGFTFYGSFEGQGEAGRKNLLEDVGVPYLASFDPSWTEDPLASGPADDSHTVGVAHYAPGRDKYGSQPPGMRRVMWLTWVCTFVLIEEAHNVLTTYEDQAGGKGKGAARTRLELCRAIEKAAKDRIAASGLLASLDEAKAALSQYCAAQQAAAAPVTPSVLTEVKASRRIKRAIERSAVAKQFPALGTPNSPARAAQAEALWQRRMLPLGRHLPYNGDPVQAVSAQERSEVPVLAQPSCARMLRLWGMNPQHVLTNSVMALECQVLDRLSGRFFTDVDNKATAFRFKDDDGNDLHILPVARMALMKAQGPALQRVWQRELEAIGGPSGAAAVIPPTPPGRPLLKWTAKKQDYKKVAPIAEEDASWLFREWLDETFPNAGNHIDSYWRDPNNPLLQIPAWIAREYPNHPHRQTWVDLIENALALRSASTELVKGSLVALRGALTITQYNIQITPKTKKSGKRWYFEGPRPDSALERRSPTAP
ncbi:hypothetical protein BDZ88DRAFT_508255 [Geranomyces variabilis]|nr:hypothetical protein BDZ88DRAFT_508255 [Geranomyces variabilis]KAJ3134481.1 hypothetical protein HDU90_005095 [Geranomyces variabilis]